MHRCAADEIRDTAPVNLNSNFPPELQVHLNIIFKRGQGLLASCRWIFPGVLSFKPSSDWPGEGKRRMGPETLESGQTFPVFVSNDLLTILRFGHTGAAHRDHCDE